MFWREIRERLLRWFAALNFILFLYFFFSFPDQVESDRSSWMFKRSFSMARESSRIRPPVISPPLILSFSLIRSFFFHFQRFLFILFSFLLSSSLSIPLLVVVVIIILFSYSTFISPPQKTHEKENFSFPSFSNPFYKLLVVSDPPFLSSSALLPTKLINVTSGSDVDWFITSAASLTAHSIIIDACLHAAYLLELKLFLKSKFPTRSRRPHSRAINREKKIIARLLALSLLSFFKFYFIKNFDSGQKKLKKK